MADSPGGNVEGIDSWLEAVTAHCEDRRIAAQIAYRTVKCGAGLKEHHLKLVSDDDDCFLYRTVINLEEYRRLALSNNFIASFDNLPQYLRQLLRAAKQENEYGQSYFINILSPGTLGLAPRVELLITTRQAGYVVQNKVLNLSLTSASDAEFKEYLTARFEKLKKEKDQLRRSASFLESQLRRERTRSREMEDKNHWLRKELKFTQNLLKSAENIQKHYEVILSLRHRGETGSTVVTIGDLAPTSSNAQTADHEPREVPLSDMATSSIATSTSATTAYNWGSPAFHKTSACSRTSEEDSRTKATKRKVSFSNTTESDSESEDDSYRQSTSEVKAKRPPPRKFAAAVMMPQFDEKLMRIRKEEEQRRSEKTSEDEDSQRKSDDEDETGKWSLPRNLEHGTEQPSPLLPSPLLSNRAMSPPAVCLPMPNQEGGKLILNTQRVGGHISHGLPRVVVTSDSCTSVVPGTSRRAYADPAIVECPSDAT